MISSFISLLMALGIWTGSAQTIPTAQLLSEHTMNLADRYPQPTVNAIMKDNILLTLAYMKDPDASPTSAIKAIEQPISVMVALRPGSVFAFHDSILPSYADKELVTTTVHFNSKEGFKSDGYLFGDGVCHLASVIRLAAEEAGLTIDAPTSHDFAVIPGIPKKYGVSIYSSPLDPVASAKQNLYITNSYTDDVFIMIKAHDDQVEVKVLKSSPQEHHPNI